MSGLGASILEEGIEEGIEQATLNFVERMLSEGESLEKISLYSGCSIEEVYKIKEQTEAMCREGVDKEITVRLPKRSR